MSARAQTKPRELWTAQLAMTDRGYAASVGNIELILRNDPAWRGLLRFDERSNVIVVDGGSPLSEVQRTYQDSDDARIAIWLERSSFAIRVAPNSAHLRGAVNVASQRSAFDPVRDTLDALRWDGEPRIDSWTVRYLGAEDTPVVRAYGRLWLISGVARAYEPGCQVDHTLVLVGSQGAGKSTALRKLALRPEWFTDALPSLSDRKAAAEVLHGRWIIELAELDALGRAELSTAKAWLTAREDRYRAAYAARADSHGRRCIFAATTNEDAFLRDATGNRRFWPLTVGRVDLAGLERDSTQLWAEAVHCYRAGERWHLTDPELVEAARDTQEGRYRADPWEPAIAAFVARHERVAVGDILSGAIQKELAKQDQRDDNRVAHVMQHLGWKRVRRRDGEGGKPRWAYERGTT